MRNLGWNRKRDFNEAAIIGALESIGCTVFRLSGDGVPDLLVHSRGVWLPLEVKRPRGKLTPSQIARQQIAPCPVVTTVTEALACFGIKG